MNQLFALYQSFRPRQWTKNFFIFAGILFSQNLFETPLLLRVIAAFILFCVISGSVYTFNDLLDIDEDRRHPQKARRPLASGRLSPAFARFAVVIVPVAAVCCAWLLGMPFFITAVSYLALQVAYSLWLKHIVILDLFSIAAGFVLRVLAGALVIDVEISSWFIICTVLLSLFLGLGKRRHEIETLEDEAQSHRPVLNDYSSYLLDQMISVVTASTVVCYALYTMSAETIDKFGTNNLVLTVPFVLYGVFRYLYLIHKKGEGGNPENILAGDLPLLVNIFLWALAAGLILYV